MHSSGIFRNCTTRFKPSTRSSTRTFRGHSFINTIYDRHYSQSKPEQPSKADVIEELEKRGLIAQVTSRAIRQHLLDHKRTIYLGIDPTAQSLHVGNLVVLIALLHFTLKGHQTIVLLGGATGSVGDPSGRNSERVALSENVLKNNVQSIEKQLEKLLSNSFKHASNMLSMKPQIDSHSITPSLPTIKNNLEWMKDLSLLEFLGSVGRVARVSAMLARDSVKQRLESGSGISFTEFTYQLLQAYDFAQLRSRYRCTIQLGGSDQYGNIMSGIELMSKLQSSPASDPVTQTRSPESDPETTSNRNVAFGLTIPLLTTREGEKFGKSAGNAVWLDPKLTSPVEFYQTFISIPDSDVLKYLKMLTFVPTEELDQCLQSSTKNPDSKRELQKLLAREVTLLVHGEKGLRQAIQGTEFLFPTESKLESDSRDHWSKEKLDETFESSPNWIELKSSEVIGRSLGDLSVTSKLFQSKGEARRAIKAGGVRFNHRQITDFDQLVSQHHLIDSAYLLLMRGKSGCYKVVKVVH
ncbi:tyrosyl-tRNA synthetase [Puccinia graminis f. sp. tritici]|uniref:Tyrosine--tRNA ligase n=1 Tax=Puccinia graminis f. sp. tritici TaxID=56615 RepID=A0A5B0RKM7_PUCGR|nr:tyrosyl-tRNA synthetase [Puccinia graminis f. sp. tritici]KAA1125979.1 tyrosyl-tRNA synthetase [Puccinia graminis f. sp. tritici]